MTMTAFYSNRLCFCWYFLQVMRICKSSVVWWKARELKANILLIYKQNRKKSWTVKRNNDFHLFVSMKPFEKVSGIIGKIALISYAMYLNHRACRFGITMINRSFLHLGDEWIFIYLAALVVYSVITYNVINAIVRKLESRKKQ